MKINYERGLFNFFCVCVGKTNWALIVTAARLAQLEERRSAEREVLSSNLGRTINQSL